MAFSSIWLASPTAFRRPVRHTIPHPRRDSQFVLAVGCLRVGPVARAAADSTAPRRLGVVIRPRDELI
jgi:hypothetical protein